MRYKALYVVSENFHIWEFIRILGAVKSKTLLRFSDFHAFHVVTARIAGNRSDREKRVRCSVKRDPERPGLKV